MVASIRVEQFKGIVPRVDDRDLPAGAAMVAENVNVEHGRLHPIMDNEPIATLGDANQKSVYKWRYRENSINKEKWLSWDKDVNVVSGPVADDQYSRIYYTGDGTPKVRGVDLVNGETVYDLGIAAPKNKLTLESFKEFSINKDGSQQMRLVLNNGTTLADVWINPQDVTEIVEGRAWTISKSINVDVSHITGDARTEAMVKVTRGDTGATENLWTTNHTNGLGDVHEVEFVPNGNKLKLQIGTTFDTWDDSGTKKLKLNIQMQIIEELRSNPATTYLLYCYTFVTKWGEEGAPSEVSEIHIRNTRESVKLSGLDSQQPTPARGVAKKYLYRTFSGGGRADFRLVAELPLEVASWSSGTDYKRGTVVTNVGSNWSCQVDNSDVSWTAAHWINIGTAEWLDTTADAELGEVLMAAEGPKDDLQGLMVMPGGYMVGFRGKEIWFSQPYLPYSWPSKYQMTLADDIVGVGNSGRDIVVGTKGRPYLLTGMAPDRMNKTRLSDNQSCVSKRGIVSLGNAVVYPSPDGLLLVRGAFTTNLTDQYYSASQWMGLGPDAMVAGVKDGKLYAFMSNANLVFDVGEQLSAITTVGESAQAVHYDPIDDKLFVVQGDKLKSWGTGAIAKVGRWRSGILVYERLLDWVWARVLADSYPAIGSDPITIRLSGDGVLALERVVLSDKEFRLPVHRKRMEWTLEIESKVKIKKMAVATNRKGLL